jgi:hypothetical protein
LRRSASIRAHLLRAAMRGRRFRRGSTLAGRDSPNKFGTARH